MKGRCGDETILYLDFGCEYMNLHMIKLYRTNLHIQTDKFK